MGVASETDREDKRAWIEGGERERERAHCCRTPLPRVMRRDYSLEGFYRFLARAKQEETVSTRPKMLHKIRCWSAMKISPAVCDKTTASTQWLVEHVKNASQNITTESIPHPVQRWPKKCVLCRLREPASGRNLRRPQAVSFPWALGHSC